MKFVKNNEEKKNELEGVYCKYAQFLYNSAFRLLQNHEDSLEIVHDAFYSALNSFSKFRNESKIQTWLYRIVINLCYNRLKKKRITFVPEEKIILRSDKYTEEHEKSEEEEKKLSMLSKAIECLTLKQKTVFTLKVYNELSYEEIAKIMRVRVGTAKATFSQTVKKLKDTINLMEKNNEIQKKDY